MTWRATALLAAVLTLLVVAGLLAERVPHEVPRPPTLLDAPVGRVMRITWDGDDAHWAVARTADGWAAEHGPVRSQVPDDLLAALATLRPVLVLDAAPDALVDFGLAPPWGRLRARGDDDVMLCDLEIGHRNPASTGVYVRRAGETPVLLVGALLDWELTKLRDAVAMR